MKPHSWSWIACVAACSLVLGGASEAAHRRPSACRRDGCSEPAPKPARPDPPLILPEPLPEPILEPDHPEPVLCPNDERCACAKCHCVDLCGKALANAVQENSELEKQLGELHGLVQGGRDANATLKAQRSDLLAWGQRAETRFMWACAACGVAVLACLVLVSRGPQRCKYRGCWLVAALLAIGGQAGAQQQPGQKVVAAVRPARHDARADLKSGWKTFLKVRDFNDPKLGKLLSDIESHMPAGHIYRHEDPGTWAHETTHGVNNRIVQEAGRGVEAFYCLHDRGFIVRPPNVTLAQIAAYVPASLRETLYSFYLIDQQRPPSQADAMRAGVPAGMIVEGNDNRPLFVIDEWIAYINGAAVQQELYGDSPVDPVGNSISHNVNSAIQFCGYATALLKCVEAEDPNYVDHDMLAEFIGWNLERAFALTKLHPQKDAGDKFTLAYWRGPCPGGVCRQPVWSNGGWQSGTTPTQPQYPPSPPGPTAPPVVNRPPTPNPSQPKPQPPQVVQGKPGERGADGAPGRNGQDGAPGRDGKDGVSPGIDDIVKAVLVKLRTESSTVTRKDIDDAIAKAVQDLVVPVEQLDPDGQPMVQELVAVRRKPTDAKASKKLKLQLMSEPGQ